MATDLTRIGAKARACPKLVFTSLYHHVTDIDNLRECFGALEGRKATGVDGVTKSDYGANLEENLSELSGRLKRLGYRPNLRKRSYIPKPGSSKKRPLGISCFEDKIVEKAVKRVLEPIYETMFEASSYGYRPERSQHQCLDELGRTIQQCAVNYVVEADIRGFFDNVNHEWLVKFLEVRIGDQRIVRLIRRMLKAGIMEDGLEKARMEEGTPQGSILSPLLSNIYLHYVLDLWFNRRIRKRCQGEAYIFRYADDFLACFESEAEAEMFLNSLRDRLEGFHLELAEEKTQRIEFGRNARERAYRRGAKPQEFDFLGFTFYCGKTRYGHFKVKRRTSRKKFQQGLRDFTAWCRWARKRLRKGAMIRGAKSKVQGHLTYYAITDNWRACSRYRYEATRILFKWLNRKSQRRSYTWDGFNEVLRHVRWPSARVRVRLCPFARPRTALNV